MRSSLALLFPLLLASCVDTPVDVPPPPTIEAVRDSVRAPDEMSADLQLVPLTGTGLRFDGVYKTNIGDLDYYMRFFERGSAAFVGGNDKYPGYLAGLLTIDVKSGWNQVHNCPVVQRNDSLFIRSVGIKGVINYLGEVRADGDSVRFLRASEITGSRQLMGYGFIPDAELEKQRTQVIQSN